MRRTRPARRDQHRSLVETLEPRVLLSAAPIFHKMMDTRPQAPVPAAPAAPINLIAGAKSWTAIQLGWRLTDNLAGGVGIYRWDNSAWHLIASLPKGTTSFVDSGLPFGSQQYYEVVAFNAGGATWAPTYATGQAVAMGVTENPHITQVLATSIQLSWNPDANAGGYLVGRWDGSQWKTIATLSANVALYTDTGMQPHTTYYYQVVRANQFGYGWFIDGENNYVSATTFDIGPPPAATNLNAKVTYTLGGNPQILLSWDYHGNATTVQVFKWDGTQWQIRSSSTDFISPQGYFDSSPTNGLNIYEVLTINDYGYTWADQYAAFNFDPAQYPVKLPPTPPPPGDGIVVSPFGPITFIAN